MKSAISIKFKTDKKKKKIFKQLFFSKIGPVLVLPLVKTQLSVYQKMFLVIRTHLTIA